MVHGMSYTICYVVRFKSEIDWYDIFPDIMKKMKYRFNPPRLNSSSICNSVDVISPYDSDTYKRIEDMPIGKHAIFKEEKYFHYLYGAQNAFMKYDNETDENIVNKEEYEKFMEDFHGELNTYDLLTEKEKEVIQEIELKIGQENIVSSRWEFKHYCY